MGAFFLQVKQGRNGLELRLFPQTSLEITWRIVFATHVLTNRHHSTRKIPQITKVGRLSVMFVIVERYRMRYSFQRDVDNDV